LMACAATFAGSKLATSARPQPDTAQCAPGVDLYGFSHALNKRTFKDNPRRDLRRRRCALGPRHPRHK
jgi:hypothetical protein